MAGNNFDVKVIARDAFDNPVADTEIEGRNIKIASSGRNEFQGYKYTCCLQKWRKHSDSHGRKVGEAAVEVHDTVTGSKGLVPA